MFSYEHLVIWDEKQQAYVRIRELHSRDEWWPLRRDAAEIRTTASRCALAVPDHAAATYGRRRRSRFNLGDRGKRQLRTKHRRAARASLEAFMNEKLLGLSWMCPHRLLDDRRGPGPSLEAKGCPGESSRRQTRQEDGQAGGVRQGIDEARDANQLMDVAAPAA